MKKDFGIYGYFILITSGVFIDYPILALFAMPLFLAGFILLLFFYHELNTSQKTERLLNSIMIFLGLLFLCGALGYSASEYFQFHGDAGRNEIPVNWIKIFIVIAINCISSLLIYLGIRKSKKLNKSDYLFVWLPTLLIIPITLFLIRLLI